MSDNGAQVTVEEAQQMLLDLVSVMGEEEVELLDALGRVLSRDIVSDIDVAPFDNSAMDGFAVRAEDLQGASEGAPVTLQVISHIGAGDFSQEPIGPGQVARIMTGAPIVPGADTVVKVEDTTTVSGDGSVGSTISFTRAPKQGENVRYRGEEVKSGDVVLASGTRLSSAAVGMCAATGHPSVWVHRRPRVAILSTGSELIEASERPEGGKIRNSNSYSLAAQAIDAGAIPVRYPPVPDDYEKTKEAFLKAADECDFIVTSGGVSVGDFDYVKPVLEELGEMLFCKVPMRPGNPQTLGTIGKVVFFGLPGNPASTYVGFETFVRPALRKMLGEKHLRREHVEAKLTDGIKKRQHRRYYLRGRLVDAGEQGSYTVEITGNQSSALLGSVQKANCFVVIDEDKSSVAAGEMVDCVRLDVEEGTV